ncbi:hypothetical protein GQ54DRAFT_298436 [Martensiomyces pterosporus]|nr:hypothetical protein GQ54DRAFT_298436 [Martensiomyces pterosporus]
MAVQCGSAISVSCLSSSDNSNSLLPWSQAQAPFFSLLVSFHLLLSFILETRAKTER